MRPRSSQKLGDGGKKLQTFMVLNSDKLMSAEIQIYFFFNSKNIGLSCSILYEIQALLCLQLKLQKQKLLLIPT